MGEVGGEVLASGQDALLRLSLSLSLVTYARSCICLAVSGSVGQWGKLNSTSAMPPCRISLSALHFLRQPFSSPRLLQLHPARIARGQWFDRAPARSPGAGNVKCNLMHLAA